MAKHFDPSMVPFDDALDVSGDPSEEMPPAIVDAAIEPTDVVPMNIDPMDVEPKDVFPTNIEPIDVEPMDEEPESLMPVWLDFLITACITIAFVLCVRVFVADTYEVPSGSMLETIQLGDRLVGEKVSYLFRMPNAGEIVTFRDPTDPRVILIKRVIATEGQTVDLIDGFVYVDGVPLDEPYVLGKESHPIDRHAETLDENISYPYVVPEGHIWVMGDNRTNSLDSRYFGAVPADTVVARALFIFWPPSDAGEL